MQDRELLSTSNAMEVPNPNAVTPSQFEESLRLTTDQLHSRGFQVYGSLSPSDSFDLVIYKDGQFRTIVVGVAQTNEAAEAGKWTLRNGKMLDEPEHTESDKVTTAKYTSLEFTDRDFQNLSDCDDIVQSLISDFQPMCVELTFPGLYYESIVQRLSGAETGWADDVQVFSHQHGDTVFLAMDHDRG